MSIKEQLTGLSRAGERVVTALARHRQVVKDFALPAAVVLAIATLFVPLPPLVISFLVVVNLALSVHVLATSLYIKSPVELTIYPALLLLTTLLRLCLSVSVMRSVLSRGDAGEVIEAIGRFSAGDVAIVGGVIFVAILVMQFLVVAKGSERVAEVAARFTLDAMQGKQLSIQADMNAGIITQDEARRQRADLQKESQLYGAMDGAMKFVKNDSIATIIIAFINIAAGFVIGVTYNGMGMAEAAHRYTILTIGDGLAASISSSLIGLSAGFVVTRVTSEADDTSLGSDISGQLFNDPKPFYIASGLLFLLGLVPAMPNILVLGAAALVGGGGYLVHLARQRAEREEGGRKAKAGVETGAEDFRVNMGVQLGLYVGAGLAPAIDPSAPMGGEPFPERLAQLREGIYQKTGVLIPLVEVKHAETDVKLEVDEYIIFVKGAPVVRGRVPLLSVYTNVSAEALRPFGLEGEDCINPANYRPGAWVPAAQQKKAESMGLTVWNQAGFLELHLAGVIETFAHEFVGVHETQLSLDYMARVMPKLVEEVLKTMSLPVVAEVLRRLAQEGISILDLKSILEALIEWSKVENEDPGLLTEYVRASLRRQICYTYARGRETLYVYTLDSEIEDIIRMSVHTNAAGKMEWLSIDPEVSRQIHKAIGDAVREPADPAGQMPVILTQQGVRRHVRKLIEPVFPAYPVISYRELTPELNVIDLHKISMRSAQHVLAGDDLDDEGEELMLGE
jgi:type III secretion protein V